MAIATKKRKTKEKAAPKKRKAKKKAAPKRGAKKIKGETTALRSMEKKISNLKKEAEKIKGDFSDAFEDKIEMVEDEVKNLKNLGRLSRDTAERLQRALAELDD